MRYVVGVVVFLAALGAIGVTMAMNASYQYGQGATPSEAMLRAVAMGVFDIVKAGLPVGMAWWWGRRQWLLLVLGGLTFGFCFMMSLVSAVGFYATNHAAVTEGRETVTVSYRDVRKELDETEKRLREIGTVRPPEMVEAAVQAMRTDRRFESSKGCADATLPTSRELCRDYFAGVGELAAAREMGRLQERRDVLKAKVGQLLKAGAERDADPQATVLSRLLPFFKLQDVKLGVDLLPSLLLEIVAGFGLLLATSMIQWSGRERGKGNPPIEPSAPPPANPAAERRKPMTFKARKDGMYVIDAG